MSGRFYLGESDVDMGWENGLVNLATFLSQCVNETIAYDACDENNWVSLSRMRGAAGCMINFVMRRRLISYLHLCKFQGEFNNQYHGQ